MERGAQALWVSKKYKVLWLDNLMLHEEHALTSKEERDACRSLEIHYHIHSAEGNKVLKREAGSASTLHPFSRALWSSKCEDWLLTAVEKWVSHHSRVWAGGSPASRAAQQTVGAKPDTAFLHQVYFRPCFLAHPSRALQPTKSSQRKNFACNRSNMLHTK